MCLSAGRAIPSYNYPANGKVSTVIRVAVMATETNIVLTDYKVLQSVLRAAEQVVNATLTYYYCYLTKLI